MLSETRISVRLRQREPKRAWGGLFSVLELLGPALRIPGPSKPKKGPSDCQKTIRGEKGGRTLSDQAAWVDRIRLKPTFQRQLQEEARQ